MTHLFETITRENLGDILDELVRRGVLIFNPKRGYRLVADEETFREELDSIVPEGPDDFTPLFDKRNRT